ncbi:integrase [Crossiella equi]|uniref:Integrase n=1 Tax=Crossiella equi TaxID=130796 RepID=A0ABS5A4J5_9PSEU|nr:tyrosine-type recombinase/integrase [Crossiella equi]MBP2471499.1 integrase [Crossiella equi]
MAHVEDRRWKSERDPRTGDAQRVKSSLYGKGLRYRVRYIDPDGKERSRSFPDKAKRQADNFLIEVESNKLEGKYVDPKAGEVKFEPYARNWLNGQSQDASTLQTLLSKLEHQLFPFFGEKRLKEIGPEQVRDWLASRREKKLSITYQAAMFNLLSAIFSAAVDDKKIGSNPCKSKGVKRPKAEQRKVVVWRQSKLDRVQLALPDRYSILPQMGAGAGLRQGEMFALSPEDIDRAELKLNVVRQIRLIDNQLVFALPKGGKTRQVPLGEGLLERFDAYMQRFPPMTVILPWNEPGGRPLTVDLILVNQHGEPCHRTHVNFHVWRAAFKQAGLVYKPREDGMHALRHFYASIMLANGVSVRELAEYLGHADPGFTLKVYTHLVPSSHQRGRKAVNGLYRPSKIVKPETA